MNLTEFMALVHLHRDMLESIALAKLKDDFAAQDAVSDIIEKAYEKRHQLRDDGKLPSWLAVITLNHCVDILRRNNPHHADEEQSEDHQDIPGRVERITLLEKILDILIYLEPEEYRDVLLLYYYREMSYKDISLELGIPEGTVKSRLSRGREALKEVIQQSGITVEDLHEAGALKTWPGILLH
jgi:RNA polymerase sigma-70 factor, ECF subfamily